MRDYIGEDQLPKKYKHILKWKRSFDLIITQLQATKARELFEVVVYQWQRDIGLYVSSNAKFMMF